jgi:hypothetical protein
LNHLIDAHFFKPFDQDKIFDTLKALSNWLRQKIIPRR